MIKINNILAKKDEVNTQLSAVDEQSVEVANQTQFFSREADIQNIDINSIFGFDNEKYMSEDTGIVTSVANYLTTDFIDITDAKFLFRYAGIGTSITALTDYPYAFFDDERNFISGGNHGEDYSLEMYDGKYVLRYDIPECAKYVRFCVFKSNVDGTYATYHYLMVNVIHKTNIANLTGHEPLKNVTIVNFGDSIFGKTRGYTSVSEAIALRTGATVINMGFGGCLMAEHSDSNFDKFSMYQIANSIYLGSFADQVSAATVEGVPAYFPSQVKLLQGIDFTKVDIITISCGTNDFTESVDIDNEIDRDDTSTFAGSLRYSIEKILTKYQHLKIVLLAPTWRFFATDGVYTGDSDTYTNGNGFTLIHFVNKMESVAEEYHLNFINNYQDLGVNYYNRLQYFSAADGTHHNIYGRKHLGRYIGARLSAMF